MVAGSSLKCDRLTELVILGYEGIIIISDVYLIMNDKERKYVIFEKFSRNLFYIKKLLSIDFNTEQKDDVYICPLSFKLYTKEGLKNHEDPLTVEHAPPKSSNGKPICLTSKSSNNIAGHSLDVIIQNHLRLEEYGHKMRPLETKFRFDNSIGVKGTIENATNAIKIEFTSPIEHQGIKKINQIITSQKEFKLTYTLPNIDQRQFDIAMLRTAYLIAFSHIGYGLLFGITKTINQSYNLIREQIQQPDKMLIEKILVYPDNYPALLKGVNIIKEPKEYRGLFIVFDLKLDKNIRTYGVMLPGPDDYGYECANQLYNDKKNGKSPEILMNNLPKLKIEYPSHAIDYYKKWATYHELTQNS
jgi:hypothetical protein